MRKLLARASRLPIMPATLALALGCVGASGQATAPRTAQTPPAQTPPAQVPPAQATAAQAAAGQHVLTEQCDPCPFTIGGSFGSVAVRFVPSATADRRREVTRLDLSSPQHAAWHQSVALHNVRAISPGEQWFLGVADVNFDGLNDLYFATSRGTANTYADYWLFDPHKHEFAYLGNYPVFTVDQEHRRLRSYERGGFGGLVYDAKEYTFIDNALTLVGRVQQEATRRRGVFRKTTYRLEGGTLRVVSRETVKAPTRK